MPNQRSEPRPAGAPSAAARDAFDVPVRRRADGSIDSRYYLDRGRRLRSRAWTGAVRGAGAALRRWLRARSTAHGNDRRLHGRAAG